MDRTTFTRNFTVVINTFIYLVFIAIIITFSLDDSDSTRQTSCAGRIDNGIPAWSIRQTIRVVYLAVLSCFSFIIAVGTIMIGCHLTSILANAPDSRHRTNSSLFMKAATVLSTAFFVYGIVFIVFAVTEYSNIAVGVALIISIELLPCSFVMWFIMWSFKKTIRSTGPTSGSQMENLSST